MVSGADPDPGSFTLTARRTNVPPSSFKAILCSFFTLKYQFQSLSISMIDYYSENGISPITTEGSGGLLLALCNFRRGVPHSCKLSDKKRASVSKDGRGKET